jgi:hypothetical protein
VNPLPRHLESAALFLAFPSWLCASLASPPLVSSSRRRHPCFRFLPMMAPPQTIVVLEPLPWTRLTVTPFALNELVNGELLAPNVEGVPPAWIVPPASDREPNPPYGYIVSFIRLHERGFAAPASCFMRACATTMGWSSTTSPPTRFPRRLPSLVSARDSWGSQ